MKNLDILPNQEVPPNIRLEVYKEALQLIQSDTDRSKRNKLGIGLCLLLPVLLWELECYCSKLSNGRVWFYDQITKMFPELTSKKIDIITRTHADQRDKIRIEFLKEMIQRLEKI